MGWFTDRLKDIYESQRKYDIAMPAGETELKARRAMNNDVLGGINGNKNRAIAEANAKAQQVAWAAEAQAALASGNAQARAAADAQAQAAARAAAERSAADAASQPVAMTEIQAGGQALTMQATRRKRAQFGRGGSTASISI